MSIYSMSTQNSCVISGLGLATPMGCEYKTFWQNAILSHNAITREKLFINSDDVQLVSKVNDADMHHGLNNRYLRKIDRFSLLAISAAKQSLESARILRSEADNYKIGILIGNSFGGWAYVEDQMRVLYKEGMSKEAINVYVSTAWFPTAAQGEISILFNIKGCSKTFSAGSISAGIAFEYAYDLLSNNRLDQVIVGGVEAPLTPLVYNACIENRIIEYNHPALCEGAAMFVVEHNDTARARGSKVYAEFSGYGTGKNLIESMSECLKNTHRDINNIDVILLNNSGWDEQDKDELSQMVVFFGGNKKCYVISIKDLYGNSVSANMSMDVALACDILENQCLPPTKMELISEYIHQGFLVNTTVTPLKIQTVLINGINNYGECLTLMLDKPKGENQ